MTDISRWYAVRVKYKAEKLVVKQLESAGITVYCPLKRYTKKYQRKVRHHQTALLPCFVFVNIDLKCYVEVVNKSYVLGFVKLGEEIVPVKDYEIELLKRIEGLALNTQVISGSIEKGTLVEVNQGPLLGLKGIVTDIRSGSRLIVQLESLPLSLSMEIAVELV